MAFNPDVFVEGRYIRELTTRSHQGYLMIRHKANGLWTIHVAVKDRMHPVVGNSVTSLADAMEKTLKILMAIQENPPRRATPQVRAQYAPAVEAMRRSS